MKYRLRKKLPFAEIGARVFFLFNGKSQFQHTNGYDVIADGIRFWCKESDIDKLLKEGWIEEIKPREFEVEFYKDGSFGLKNNRGDILMGIMNSLQTDPIEIIKVREVIDE